MTELNIYQVMNIHNAVCNFVEDVTERVLGEQNYLTEDQQDALYVASIEEAIRTLKESIED